MVCRWVINRAPSTRVRLYFILTLIRGVNLEPAYERGRRLVQHASRRYWGERGMPIFTAQFSQRSASYVCSSNVDRTYLVFCYLHWVYLPSYGMNQHPYIYLCASTNILRRYYGGSDTIKGDNVASDVSGFAFPRPRSGFIYINLRQ